MGRPLPNQTRMLALIAALVFVHGCVERKILEKEAPALARADLRVDRIAVGGVVSDVPELGDSTESRAYWSFLIGNQLGRQRFGKLPIVTSSEVREILGRDDYGVMLDRFKGDGACDGAVLSGLHTALEGKARFVVFGNIQEDRIQWSESESEEVDEKNKTTTKTKTMTTARIVSVRLRFYDLTDQQLAWDHLTVGQTSKSKKHDTSDVIEHDEKEGFLGGLVKSLVNSAIKPDPKYPETPLFEESLENAFYNVGAYLKPSKKK